MSMSRATRAKLIKADAHLLALCALQGAMSKFLCAGMFDPALKEPDWHRILDAKMHLAHVVDEALDKKRRTGGSL